MYNEVINFIGNNSGLLTALIISLIGLFTALISKNKQQVYAGLPDLISKAQSLELANDAKFAYVLDIAYNLIPKVFKVFISKQSIARAIEFTFNKLKEFAKEQAKANSIKETSAIAADNIASGTITGAQQAAEVVTNTSDIVGMKGPIGVQGTLGIVGEQSSAKVITSTSGIVGQQDTTPQA